jgi:hypothetical protein
MAVVVAASTLLNRQSMHRVPRSHTSGLTGETQWVAGLGLRSFAVFIDALDAADHLAPECPQALFENPLRSGASFETAASVPMASLIALIATIRNTTES